jgi:excisionase family DNA binding protein
MQSMDSQYVETKLLYSKPEAAAILSISERLLDQLIATHKLQCRRVGRRVLVHRHSLEAFAALPLTEVSESRAKRTA